MSAQDTFMMRFDNLRNFYSRNDYSIIQPEASVAFQTGIQYVIGGWVEEARKDNGVADVMREPTVVFHNNRK